MAGVLLVAKKTANVRLTPEADRLAEIASGYTGESKAEYVTRVVSEAALRDIERGHAELAKGLKPSEPPAKSRRPRGGE